MTYHHVGAERMTAETNKVRTDGEGVVSCEHYRTSICNKCMDLVTGYKSGPYLNDVIRPLAFQGFINRGQDVAPGIPVTYCDCGDRTSHSAVDCQ